MSDSAAPPPPTTSNASSIPELLLLLLLLLGAAACTPDAPPLLVSAQQAPHDPLRALPDAPRYLEDLGAVDVSERGAAALEVPARRFGQSSSPIAHLLLHRAFLHAALYAELTQRSELRDELAALLDAQDLWDALLSAFQEDRASVQDDPALALAAEDAAALARLLRDRRMDAAYHRDLNALARQDGPFAAEARLARLLDLRDARDALLTLPLHLRLDAFVLAFAPGLCAHPERLPAADDPALDLRLGSLVRDACPLECDPNPPGAPEILTQAACGWDQLGWPIEAHPDLYEPRIALIARLYRRAIDDLIALHVAIPHPLSRLVVPALDALHADLATLPLPLLVPLDAPDDLPRLHLPDARATTPALPEPPDSAHLITLDQDALRLAVVPAITLDTSALAFADERLSLQLPGRHLLNRGALHDPRRADDLQLALESALADADTLLPRSDGPRPPLPLLADKNAALADLRAALPPLAEAFGGHRTLGLALAAWSPEGPRYLPLAFSPGQPWGRERWEDLPPEARPLDLTLQLTDGALELYARGERAGALTRTQGHLDPRDLGEALLKLAGRLDAIDALDIEASGQQLRVVDLLDLLDALGQLAMHPRILLFSAAIGEREPPAAGGKLPPNPPSLPRSR